MEGKITTFFLLDGLPHFLAETGRTFGFDVPGSAFIPAGFAFVLFSLLLGVLWRQYRRGTGERAFVLVAAAGFGVWAIACALLWSMVFYAAARGAAHVRAGVDNLTAGLVVLGALLITFAFVRSTRAH